MLQSKGHYCTEKSADNTTDLRTTYKYYQNASSSLNSGLPSASEAGNYFYLPALGNYISGQLYDVGRFGYYWSSSADPGLNYGAYSLSFSSGYVDMGSGCSRSIGLRVEPTFE